MKYNTDQKTFTNSHVGMSVKVGQIIDLGTMDTLVNNYISENYGIDDNEHDEKTFSLCSYVYNDNYDVVKIIDVGVELLDGYTLDSIKELSVNYDEFCKVPCKVIFLNKI